MKIYDDLDALVEDGPWVSGEKIPIGELMNSKKNNYIVSFTTTDGQKYNWPFKKWYDHLKYRQKHFGYVRGNVDISIWFDREKTDILDLIHLYAHELGHTIRPFYRNSSKEERKAEKYAEIAVEAYKRAIELINKK